MRIVEVLPPSAYSVQPVSYCRCGSDSANLLASRSFFPSKPLKPRTVFAINLLKLFHLQCVRGAISKLAWAEGWRAFFEEEMGRIIPSFHRQLLDAYHHWVAVQYEIETRAFRSLEDFERTLPPIPESPPSPPPPPMHERSPSPFPLPIHLPRHPSPPPRQFTSTFHRLPRRRRPSPRQFTSAFHRLPRRRFAYAVHRRFPRPYQRPPVPYRRPVGK